jgi:NitT/TauT family transport system substrate-binding protein
MHTRHRLSFCASLLMLAALLSFTLAACGSSASTAGGSTSSPTPGRLTNVSIAFGYIPDIQFSPFYVAQSKGYYKAAGLNVTFQHGFVNDLIGSLALGHETFVFATGDEELVARSKNLPVVDVSRTAISARCSCPGSSPTRRARCFALPCTTPRADQ